MKNKTPEQLLLELESFRFGTLLALISLKAAIQKSPDFNQTVLEDCVTQFLALPPNKGDRDSFEGPLRALLNDQSSLLKQTLHQG
ncbi:hypothetical protein J2794_003570 [Paraburkholderia terricola]|uniref:hypothetical protein n=1 Tax=Paraburkholderia terricola TaxID=169427 RepID=UPI0028657500|nr:hypothetical protein [Paraburkholderia terricola]MDR6447454.1 hypothetical protein [Paraburkholderia terricola]